MRDVSNDEESHLTSLALVRRLSASAIDRFRLCPQQFRLNDIERVQGQREVSGVLVQANAVHHALERFFGLPLDDRQPENLAKALRSVWPNHRRKGAFADPDEEIEYGREALRMLELFSERFALDAQPIAREQWLSGRTQSGVELIGKLDRVDRRGDLLTVLDYKTGRRMLEPEDLRHEPAVWAYVTLAEATYRQPVDEIRFIYLRHGLETVWQPERDDVEELKRKLSGQIKVIREERDFVAIPGSHCRFCPFALSCEERTQVELADLQPVEGLPF